jgi:hypothetical protein
MSFSRRLAFCTRFAEMKALGDTLGYTGRFQTLINPIHAEIAFDRFAGLRIPLGRSPRTGRDACFAAHTELFVHVDNTIFGSFLHRTGGTGCDTPGILAVKTGHKYVSHAGKVVNFSWTDRDYLGQPRSNGQIIFYFAV